MINDIKSIHELIKIPSDKDVKAFLSASPGDYVSNHWHNALEIIYIISGELTVSIQNESYILTSNKFILINSKTVHSTKCTNPNNALVLQIPYDYIKRYINNIDTIIFHLPYNSKDPLDILKLAQIQDILKNMCLTLNNSSDGNKLKFNSLLFELLYELHNNFKLVIPKTQYIKHSKNLSSLEPILTYIQENYSSSMSIDDISKVAGFQPKYFCRFFKKHMGLTFLEYLCELRLSYIYHDLLATDIPLYQILETHGFTNYKLFRRTFNNRFNCTPSDIRKFKK